MRDDRGIADAFYSVVSVGVVVIAGIALASVVLGIAGQQGTTAAEHLGDMGARGMRKGVYGLYYTIDTDADLASSDPNMIPPGAFVAERIDTTLALRWSSLPGGAPDEGVVIWTGYLLAREAGDYRFELESAGGSWLWIDGALVADNHGQHPLAAVRSSPVRLEEGYHRIKARYFYTDAESSFIRARWDAGGAWSDLPCFV
jgi:hypothetical protein